MTFASFGKPGISSAIKFLADADKLAVVVGAGVSAEAGLPGWRLLVERLLTQASRNATHFVDEHQREEWVQRTLRTELPPGIAGIAQTLLGTSLPAVLRTELYRPPDGPRPLDPSAFFPGPTAHAVAALRVAHDQARPRSRLKIFTTNYDELLEQALRKHPETQSSTVVPVYWPQKGAKLPPDRIKVHHLHGYFEGRKPRGVITLTDSSYAKRDAAIQARDDEIRHVLSEYTCLFLGTSFSDPNIIRFVFEAADEWAARNDSQGAKPKARHVALFTHHSSDPPSILKVREEIAQSRLEEAYTQSVFVDHYADVSQFVYEVRNRIVDPHQYEAHEARARRLLRPVLREVVFPKNKRKFDLAQVPLNDKLTTILRSAMRATDREFGSDLGREEIALAVWLLDEKGVRLTPWITTDRVHRGPALLQSVEVQPGSRWLAVRAVCEGRTLSEPRHPEDSRWSYIVGSPLFLADGSAGQVCAGAVTITTLTDADSTWLERLDRAAKVKFVDQLTDEISEWLIAAAAQ